MCHEEKSLSPKFHDDSFKIVEVMAEKRLEISSYFKENFAQILPVFQP